MDENIKPAPNDDEKFVIPLDLSQQVEPIPKKPFYRNKRNVIIFVATIALVGIFAGWYSLFNNSSVQQPVRQTDRQIKLLGADVTVVDGSVQISADGTSWQELKLETKIKQGDIIKTSENGRTVVTLDDGSAVRVNNISIIKLVSLAADNVIIANEVGEVYTRIVKSDRKFSVKIGNESYTALGTAYTTINREAVKGVEVYHSEVMVKTARQKITEGKQYFQASATPELNRKVTDIPLDKLQKDDFLKWNLEYDKKDTRNSDKLGYLLTLEKLPIPTPTPATVPVPNAVPAGIVLSGSKTEKGTSLSWKVTGLTASKGFKVLKGTAANPIYGQQDAIFLEASARSTTWKITDGKTYHFRVCIYQSNGTCTDYSNDITVTAPYVAPAAKPTGTLSLSHVSGNNVAWSLSGSAPNGLKLVWSTSPEPTYPGSSTKYFEGTSTTSAVFEGDSGISYYLRVCMYYEGTCANYSNQITVTLPY